MSLLDPKIKASCLWNHSKPIKGARGSMLIDAWRRHQEGGGLWCAWFTFDENKFKNVKVRLPKRDYRTYDDTDFKATLERTWAVVNHSSNPAMEAVMRGIPVFVSESSLCHDVGNIKLAEINTPAMPNRLTWTNQLAYTEWFEDEIEQGLPWARIKARLLEKYLK